MKANWNKSLTVWQLPAAETQALTALAQRTMKLNVTVQDGTVWVGDGSASVEITPVRIYGTD